MRHRANAGARGREDESGRLTLSEVDPGRYTQAGTATNWLEARVTFRLDRLLFADEEVSLERLRADRAELRSRSPPRYCRLFSNGNAPTSSSRNPRFDGGARGCSTSRARASAVLDVMTGRMVRPLPSRLCGAPPP